MKKQVLLFLLFSCLFSCVEGYGQSHTEVTQEDNNVFTGSAPITVQGDHPVVLGGSLSAKRINGVRFADQFSGANGGAQINSALADLGSTTGRVVANEGMTFGGFNAPANNQTIWDYRQTQDILNNAPPGTLATRPTVLTINQNLGDFSTAALTGTVTITNGSTAVTGVGTKFTTEVNPAYFFGPAIHSSGDASTCWAIVASVTDDTHATLQSNYTCAGGSGNAVLLVGQEGLLVQEKSTGGNPGDFKTGEWVGLSIFSNRTAGGRGQYGININQTFSSPPTATQGQVYGIELDSTNTSGTNCRADSIVNCIGFDLNAVGPNTSGVALYCASGHWNDCGIFANWTNVGLYMQGGSEFLQFVPTADNANVQLHGFKADGATTTWRINNDGSSLWTKNANFTNSPLPITISSTSGSSQLRCDVLSTFFCGIQYTNTALQRWLVGKNGTAESGSNVGSDYDFNRYNDAGLLIDTPLRIIRSTGQVQVPDSIAVANLLISGTAPTISSAFGTSPSIPNNNGTAAFTINVGTGGTATNGVIALPTAAHGWACHFDDVTTQSATVFVTKQIATTASTATIANVNTSGAQAAWAASDVLVGGCNAY